MIGAKYYKNKIPFGVIETRGDKFDKIIEKPEKKFLINTGIYLLKGKYIARIPENKKYNMTDLINELKKSENKVGVYKIKEMWKGIENIDDLTHIRRRM